MPGGQEPSVAAGETGCPRAIRLAGMLSIISGSVLLFNTAVSFLLSAAVFAWVGPGRAVGIAPLALVTGLLCLYSGKRIRRRQATTASSLGIISFICGLLNIAFATHLAAVLLVVGQNDLLHYGGGEYWYRHLEDRNWAFLVGGVSVIAGIGLIMAGGLALFGREQYQAWRRQQEG